MSDQRLDGVADKIAQAKEAAKVLADHDQIDPEAGEGSQAGDGEVVKGD